MPELVVITGPPGAGKSSVAEHLADSFTPSALVAGDSFFAMIKQGYIMPWLPESPPTEHGGHRGSCGRCRPPD
jgi:2-phosphoglycerate kinase